MHVHRVRSGAACGVDVSSIQIARAREKEREREREGRREKRGGEGGRREGMAA